MDLARNYLESVKKQFQYYKAIGEKAMEQLEPEQFFVMANEDSNSIATIVKHLWGNMVSRWTDFRTSDGEKAWRDRDAEFVNDLNDKEDVLRRWNEGWTCFLQALDTIEPEQLMDIIYIRNEGHTIMEAINRQLAHYPYHIGQIIYSAKWLKKNEWDSLSIPRKASRQYNQDKQDG